MVALLALAATYLTPLVNADWNAWRYDHGHASITNVVGEHSHPWEDDHAPGDGGDEAGDRTSDLVYTASSDSVPGLTAIWARPADGIATLLAAFPVELAVLMSPASEGSAPSPPPPKEALSHA